MDADVVRVLEDGRLQAAGVGTTTVSATSGGRTADALIYVGAATYDLATLGPPRVLTVDYIDLSKIGRISRFRSTVGHSYADGYETCRSMKHYFQPRFTEDWTSVDVYAPATGMVIGVARDGSWGHRVSLRPRDAADVTIMIFHVAINAGLVRGTWLNAGDHIGKHSSSGTMSDIAVSIGPKETGRLISYFEAITDPVFALYQARGITSRGAAIITEAERDADPAPCVGEQQFTVHGTIPDWLDLN
jgi:hypothetical protein